MKFYFLLALVPFLSCHSESPVNNEEDSVLTSITFNSDSTALIPGYSLNKTRRKLKSRGFHGATFKFEIDSTATDKYLLIFGRDEEMPEFQGVIYSNHSYQIDDSIDYEKQINEVGNVEFHYDTLVYYGYTVTTKIKADSSRTSSISARMVTLVFRKDGTMLSLLMLFGQNDDTIVFGQNDPTIYQTVKSKLAKQIAAMPLQ